MDYKDIINYIQYVGKDPSLLVFEDELTGIYNRRFLSNYFQFMVDWDCLSTQPLSLIMMDLDHFKQINDTYGHIAGDQVLVWIGHLLKAMAGEKNIAVRYAGDEFMILMPGADKEAALKVGEQIIGRLAREAVTLQVPEKAVEIHITISVGVASAPEDAYTGNELIHQADTALYNAKKAGRKQVVNARRVVPKQVFFKTAINRLDSGAIAGRRRQLAGIAGAFKRYSQTHSRFVIIEGASGMGKSEFLRVLRRHLTKTKIAQISVEGLPQEGFSPYYLTESILVGLLNQQPDNGSEILDELTPKEIYYLSHLLPQLGDPADLSLQLDEKTQREQIFTTIINFFSKLLNSRPLILFIDDLHYCDGATLLALRQLLLRGEVPLFVCGTSIMIQTDQANARLLPLEKFFSAYKQELDIEKITLTPLSAQNITDHFKQIFPQVILPANFAPDLLKLTQGNPLFISEIQRKLVLDGKITLSGRGWTIEPLTDDYLPQSLDEIVSQKLASLDEESRQLLDQASTFGEKVSLSVLAGSSNKRETKALEIIDNAVSQGLISSEYQMNDETIRFKGKQILNITYAAIDKARKMQLHERVANYQEILYKQRLLPSAATLAYHFQRSANQDKTRIYRERQQNHDRKIFNAEEAASYADEGFEDTIHEVLPLDPASLPLIPIVIRTLLTAVRNIKLYPPGSKSIIQSTLVLRKTLNKVLAKNDRLDMRITKNSLVVNGEPVNVTEYKSFTEAFVRFFNQLELCGIAFSRDFREKELTGMLQGLGHNRRKLIDRYFWQRFSAEQHLLNIELKQIRYTTKVPANENQQGNEMKRDRNRAAAVGDSAGLPVDGRGLDEKSIGQIAKVLRPLISAGNNIMLYPPESVLITTAIENFHEALKTFLAKNPALTLARVGNSLLINGQKLDASEFKAVTEGSLKLMKFIRLKSLSFLETTNVRELQAFIRAIANGLSDSIDSLFWPRMAKEQHLTGILFDQRVYATLEERTGSGNELQRTAADPGPEEVTKPVNVNSDAVAAFDSQPVKEKLALPEEALRHEEVVLLTADQLVSMAVQIIDLLHEGDKKQVRGFIIKLFKDYTHQTCEVRRGVIKVCCDLMEYLIFGSRPGWVKRLIEPLLPVLQNEEHPEIRNEMLGLLSRTATNLIQFGDYQLAGRIFLNLRRHQKQLEDKSNGQDQLSGTTFPADLEPEAQMLLLEDFKSREASRIQRAARLLSSLGPVSTPMLVKLIKNEENLRTRQIACRLLKEFDLNGGELLKRDLVLENTPAARVRILEVIDSVTRELAEEMALSLDDDNPVVRRAALRLAERLNDSQTISLLLDYAMHENPSVATESILTLGKLRNPTVTEALISLLDDISKTDRLIACCRALGRQADPAAIEPLANIMAPRWFLWMSKKKTFSLRANAAYALAQIKDPRAADVLAGFLNDRDPGIRRIAHARVTQSKPCSPVVRN